MKRSFPHINKNGQQVYLKKVDIVVPNKFILDLVKEGKLRKLKEYRTGLGHLYRVSYGSSDRTEKCYLKASIGHKGSMGFTEKTKFIKVPLLERHFVKVIKVWKDKRKGYENRSYATYETKLKINHACFKTLKPSHGKIKAPTHKGSWRFRDFAIGDYVSMQLNTAKNVHKITFKRDSQGHWN